MTERGAGELRVVPVDGLPEVRRGDDLAALVAAATELLDGDVVAITSKVLAKAAGLVRRGDRAEALAGETDRVVATRGRTTIVRTHHGLVLAAGGIDASNTEPGTIVPLPREPDRSARELRTRLGELTGRNVGVVVTDTAGRAWRTGQTDIAIGVAGLVPADDHAGRVDPHGNRLVVTAPAIADEVAAAADLVKGKLRGRPVAVVRGLAHHVLPPGRHGPGAVSLVRPETEDLFGYGAREAVLRALAGDPADLRGFGAPAPAEEVLEVLAVVLGGPVRKPATAYDGEAVVVTEADPGRLARVAAAAYACGWLPDGSGRRFRPAPS